MGIVEGISPQMAYPFQNLKQWDQWESTPVGSNWTIEKFHPGVGPRCVAWALFQDGAIDGRAQLQELRRHIFGEDLRETQGVVNGYIPSVD